MKNLILTIFLASSVASFAQTEPKVEPKAKDANFRCERYRDRNISTLKEKLVENCDLNKPFSTSLSTFAGEDTILYCCNTKK